MSAWVCLARGAELEYSNCRLSMSLDALVHFVLCNYHVLHAEIIGSFKLDSELKHVTCCVGMKLLRVGDYQAAS